MSLPALPPGATESLFQVRGYEVDRDRRLRPEGLFHYLLEAAHQHSSGLGRGPEFFLKHSVNWFLLRIHVTVRRYPRQSQTVRVRTWPYRMKGLYAIREFQVLDEEGRTLADGTSQWVLVDLTRRRPIRLPEWVVKAYTIHEERRVEDEFAALPAIGRAGSSEEAAGEEGRATGTLDQIFLVRLSDLDVNQHATSASYFDWCLEVVPEDVHEAFVPRSIEIQYKKEVGYRERVRTTTAGVEGARAEAPEFHHVIHRVSGGELLAIGRSRWGKEE